MQAYASRLQSGDSSDSVIIQDLEPLAENDDAIAQFFLASGFYLKKRIQPRQLPCFENLQTRVVPGLLEFWAPF